MQMSLPSVGGYLATQAEATHVLAQLLREPEEENGVFHTPREIAQQPLLWRYTAEKMMQIAPDLSEFLWRENHSTSDRRPTFVLVGAGTSDYVGLSIADLLRTQLETPTSNCATTRITASPQNYLSDGSPRVMVHFARSGNSPESRAVLNLALSHHGAHIRHIVITCNADGELALLARKHPQNAFLIVLDEATNDQGLAMTSSYSTMVVAGQALAYLNHMDGFRAQIEQVSSAAEYLLHTHVNLIHELSRPDIERAIFLGTVDLLGAATESALKIQELTNGQVMATSEDTLAFRHGPISAVNEKSLVCFFLSANSYTRRYELDVLFQYQDAFQEIGAETLVVSPEPLGARANSSVKVISYNPESKWHIPVFFQVQIAAMVGQLLGLFSSYRRKLNVDSPSEDKSLYNRTVQGVQLYGFPDGER